jgi:hypothetical protein
MYCLETCVLHPFQMVRSLCTYFKRIIDRTLLRMTNVPTIHLSQEIRIDRIKNTKQMDKERPPGSQFEIVHQVGEKYRKHVEPQTCQPLRKCVLEVN